jgi:hypothetical protein
MYIFVKILFFLVLRKKKLFNDKKYNKTQDIFL